MNKIILMILIIFLVGCPDSRKDGNHSRLHDLTGPSSIAEMPEHLDTGLAFVYRGTFLDSTVLNVPDNRLEVRIDVLAHQNGPGIQKFFVHPDHKGYERLRTLVRHKDKTLIVELNINRWLLIVYFGPHDIIG